MKKPSLPWFHKARDVVAWIKVTSAEVKSQGQIWNTFGRYNGHGSEMN